jgi:hypothetical protein
MGRVDLGRTRRDPLARQGAHQVAQLLLLAAQGIPRHALSVVALQNRPNPTDEAIVAARSRILQIVGGLTRAANELPLAVAYSTDGKALEMLAPPQHLATSCDVFAAKVLAELLDRFGPGGLSTVGVLAPAAEDVNGIRIVRRAIADGMLVCAAEQETGGAGSAAIFRPEGAKAWQDVHIDAAWICGALRALVADGILGSGETGRAPDGGSRESRRALDDDVESR